MNEMSPVRGVEADAEKCTQNPSPQLSSGDGISALECEESASDSAVARYYKAFERQLVAYSFEPRGIRRVESYERQDLKSFGFLQAASLWFSINLAANNVTLGMLGPTVFYLGFLDASLCSVFGMLVGSLAVAYIATFGPLSGCRSLVISRFAMGWWPAKLIVVLNIIVLLGYAMIDTVVAGQILSAVSPNGSLSVVVGIVITALIAWIVCGFGYTLVHQYTRYAWLPQMIVFCVFAGVAGPKFDLSTPSSGDPRTVIGNRLSFFSLCLSAAITYAGESADYFVYYPEETPRWKLFVATLMGLLVSFTFAFILGIGLGTGIAGNKSWGKAYDVSQGALIVQGFEPLGTFGKFCAVIVALGLIANLIPPTYSGGVDFQILGRLPARIPRLVWNSLGVVIYTACALAGRNHLAEIFTNFLALMGYWVSIWIAILLEEHYVFRAKRGFDWSSWDNRSKLPLGLAALVAFLIGWAGAIICMAQFWYIGPLARLVGDYGADMGNYVGFSWAGLVFLPLRYLELKKIGR